MTQSMTWGRHPDYANGTWIKLYKGKSQPKEAERKAQGFELRFMPLWFHPEGGTSRILTDEDKKAAFICATNNMQGATSRWQQRAESGLNDEQLHDALRYELGIAGGSSCADSISVSYAGAGLKIWASWQSVNDCIDAPIFEGKQTIAMARLVYGITDASDTQMALF